MQEYDEVRDGEEVGDGGGTRGADRAKGSVSEGELLHSMLLACR